jgi:hypothetical protein
VTSQDWAGLASVYRAGAKIHRDLMNQPYGSYAEARAHDAMADRCDEIAAERAAQERASHHNAVKGGLS